MSRRPARFTQADYARAIRAFEQTHPGVAGTVKMCGDGGFLIVPIDHKPGDDEAARIARGREIVL